MKIPKVSIPPVVLELFKKEGIIKKLKNKDHLVREGEIADGCYLLEQGVLRYYFCTEEGQEITRVFIKQVDIPLAYRFFSNELKSTGSFYSIQSLGESTIKSVPWKSLMNLVEQNHDAALFFLRKNEEIYFYRERSLRRNTKMAPENYQEFLEDYADVLPNISSRIISSYLNISPESLSRLKKKY